MLLLTLYVQAKQTGNLYNAPNNMHRKSCYLSPPSCSESVCLSCEYLVDKRFAFFSIWHGYIWLKRICGPLMTCFSMCHSFLIQIFIFCSMCDCVSAELRCCLYKYVLLENTRLILTSHETSNHMYGDRRNL